MKGEECEVRDIVPGVKFKLIGEDGIGDTEYMIVSLPWTIENADCEQVEWGIVDLTYGAFELGSDEWDGVMAFVAE